MMAKRLKLLLLSGTPIINNPYEILNLCNLLRGPITTYTINKKIDIDKKYLKYIDTLEVKCNKTILTLLPDNYVKTDKYFIKFENSKFPLKLFQENKFKVENFYCFPTNEKEFKEKFYIYNDKNELVDYKDKDIISRRIMGLVSFFDRYGDNYPELLEPIYKRVKLSDPQFDKLIEKLDIESSIDEMNRKKKHLNALDDETSVYKTYSRAVCNFAFPNDIKRNYPSDQRKIIKDLQLDEDVDIAYEKHLIDVKNKFIKKYEKLDPDSRNKLLRESSAKYMEMIQDINDNDGKVLIYSQFRTLEGVGMLSVYLDMLGFSNVSYNKTGTTVKFNLNKEKVNYMIYDLDKEVANEQIKAFNSKENINGEKIKILIITLSGSEGISLKNVRNVLIMEPHWNWAIIKQVIGRAVRDGSHLDLPLDKRNVKTYIYLTSATNEQIKKNDTFRLKYESKTTYEVVILDHYRNMLILKKC